MADSDDEQTAALEPGHKVSDEDGVPGAPTVGEDRRAKEWQAGADLDRPAQLQAAEDEDVEAAREAEHAVRQDDEQAELDAREERERLNTRYRQDVNQANADVAEALRLAHVEESAQRNLRSRELSQRESARTDVGHAARLRAGAAGRDDDPQAEADRSTAHHLEVRGQDTRNSADVDATRADWHGGEGRERRRDAADVQRPEQPPAGEVVRTPPKQAPSARKFLTPQQRRKKKTKELRDFGIGD